MNLKLCRSCNNKRICKYYDSADPRYIEGVCEASHTKITQVPKQEEPQVKQLPLALNPKITNADTKDIQPGDRPFIVRYGTGGPYKNTGYTVSVMYVTKANIDHVKKQWGNTIFKTREEAIDAAKINLYCKSSADK